MSDLACPKCLYTLDHLREQDTLVCPECGTTCTRREAMMAPYERRNAGIDLDRQLFFAGTGFIVLSLVFGSFTSWALAAWGCWIIGHAICLTACVSYARHSKHGFGSWWPIAGPVIFIGWTVLVHGVTILLLMGIAAVWSVL